MKRHMLFILIFSLSLFACTSKKTERISRPLKSDQDSILDLDLQADNQQAIEANKSPKRIDPTSEIISTIGLFESNVISNDRFYTTKEYNSPDKLEDQFYFLSLENGSDFHIHKPKPQKVNQVNEIEESGFNFDLTEDRKPNYSYPYDMDNEPLFIIRGFDLKEGYYPGLMPSIKYGNRNETFGHFSTRCDTLTYELEGKAYKIYMSGDLVQKYYRGKQRSCIENTQIWVSTAEKKQALSSSFQSCIYPPSEKLDGSNYIGLYWMGDLDRDGKLDFIIRPDPWQVFYFHFFLSSYAETGDIAKEVYICEAWPS